MKLSRWVVGVFAVVAALASAQAAFAQSGLASADAKDFIGVWTLTLDSPQGAFEQTVTLKDTAGKVACEISSQLAPGAQAVTDISKAGSDLVLKFEGDFQGQAFAAKITLTPSASDKATAVFDINDGQFSMMGSAVKK